MGTGVLTAVDPYRDPLDLFDDAGLERAPDGLLRIDDLRLDAIAADVGTPAYVYNAARIRARYDDLARAFAGYPTRIHYAVKSNSNLAILALLQGLGAGADIVSRGELERAIRAGVAPGDIVFSGVGKTQAELEAACALDLGSINLESADELTALERLVDDARRPTPLRVGIRINPDIAAATHRYIATGAEGIKFGVAPEQARAMADRIALNPRLELVTLAMHLGSQILEPDLFATGAGRLVALRNELVERGLRGIRAIDVGGGFGIRYTDEPPIDLPRLAAALIAVLEGTGLELHLEPGRFLTGSAGVLLSRVLYRKRSGAKDFVVVDAAMNDLLRPSHYEARHAVVEVASQGRAPRRVDVVGPVCESGDFLALDHVLPDLAPGELVAILCVGAYGFVMASNYNTRTRPPEVLVDRGRFAVIRRRETLDHLLTGEVAHPFAPQAP